VEELGVTLDEHIQFVIDALKPVQKENGLGPREELASAG
jgi:predicted hydrolase (HD superfamily)